MRQFMRYDDQPSLRAEESYQRKVAFETGEAIEDALADLATAVRRAGEALLKLDVLERWTDRIPSVRLTDAQTVASFEACVLEAARDRLSRDGEDALTVLGEGL